MACGHDQRGHISRQSYPASGNTDQSIIAPGLTNVTSLPTTAQSTRARAFAYCDGNVATVTIPGDITNFADVFSTLPDPERHDREVTAYAGIADGEFSAFPNLTNVLIPNSVTSIGDYAFESCDLTNLTIPDAVTSIGVDAFASCALTNLVLPGSVTSVGNVAFENCSHLTAVAISSGVTNCERVLC